MKNKILAKVLALVVAFGFALQPTETGFDFLNLGINVSASENLDFTNASGDVSGDYYEWNNTEKVLTLKGGFSAGNITMPKDSNIEIDGNVTTGTITFNGADSGNTIRGSGTLTATSITSGSGYYLGLTVRNVSLKLVGGINAESDTLTLNNTDITGTNFMLKSVDMTNSTITLNEDENGSMFFNLTDNITFNDTSSYIVFTNGLDNDNMYSSYYLSAFFDKFKKYLPSDSQICYDGEENIYYIGDSDNIKIAPIVMKAHEHNWTETWETNETHHWHTCENCCITDISDMDGYGEHSFGEPTWEWNSTSEAVATFTCDTCKKTTDVTANEDNITSAVTDPTCTEDGYTTYTANVTFNGMTYTDKYKEDKTDSAGHTYGEWVTAKEPTETEKGEKYRECTVCGKRVTEEIETLSHSHEVDTSSWLNDENSHWHRCLNDDCDEKLNKEVHTFGDWIISKEPTETENGEKYRECTVCGKRVTEEIETFSHSHEVDTSSWLNDENSHWHKCLNDDCDEKLNKEVHTFGDWIISKEPTETENGEKYRECTVCGKRVTEEIEKLDNTVGKSFVAANVRSKSYIYVYDTDMDLIKVFKTKKNADTIKVNLSDKYAGKTVRLYIGKKSTTGDYTKYVLDENGDVTIEVDEKTNYTLVLT